MRGGAPLQCAHAYLCIGIKHKTKFKLIALKLTLKSDTKLGQYASSANSLIYVFPQQWQGGGHATHLYFKINLPYTLFCVVYSKASWLLLNSDETLNICR